MIQKLSLIVVISIFAVGCAKDEGPFNTTEIVDLNDTLQVSFKIDVQPIFDSYCTSCHGSNHSKLVLINSQSYNQLMTDGAKAPYINISDPENSIIMGYLNGKPTYMPPSGSIPEFEKEVILKWIGQGAKNN
ncbi:MAG: hypothetical protein ACLGGV_01510 [Bacteroidia bacterium]